MAVNERVARLRQKSLDTKPKLSPERALLLTEFYQTTKESSIPVRRARAFEYVLKHKTISINQDELIVGERGPAPKETPTYPELCCHSLEDLDTIDAREKIAFAVTKRVRDAYRDTIIPFWQGRSMRETILQEMTPAWHAAYEAGIFTEFMEQRAPGHTVLDDKIYRRGFVDFKRDIRASRQAIDPLRDPDAYNKLEELKAMEICADALTGYALRYADMASSMATGCTNPQRKAELERMAEVCRHVPAHAPRNMWEAIQYYWFVHLGVITELNTWDAFSPGRLDQHLFPFYERDIANETLDHEQARELLQCLWIKFNNQPAPPKVGVTLAESSTYTDFATINHGGLKADGSDGVNDVTYLLLEVIDEMRLLQPSTNIQLSKKNPDRFLKKALAVIRKGWGQPSVFNADAVIQEMLRQGKRLEDARMGGTSGCVETGAFGKESYILTGYLNLVKILEITLNNGLDPRTGETLGPPTGDPDRFCGFDDLMDAYRTQLAHFLDIKLAGNQVIERLYATLMPCPFLSLLIDDCIQNGKDYNAGGARYNTNYVQGVGLGTLTDSMVAIKYHVFDNGFFDLGTLNQALAAGFADYADMQLQLRNLSPKYGNDDDYADDVMVRLFNTFYKLVEGRPNTKGGVYRINMLPTTCHVYFGSVTGATPDGRNAYEPFSEGISPVQGMDRQGPTAVIKSAAKMDHLRTGGTLLNLKFTPQILEGESGISKLAHLVRTYFRLDGHHVQFNVVSAKTLRAAQANPERYGDLIVRVAGYSDYFCDLTPQLQAEIIARTEHQNI